MARALNILAVDVLESWTVRSLCPEAALVCRAGSIDELSHNAQLPQTADMALPLSYLYPSLGVSPEHRDLPLLVYSVHERRRMNKRV